MSIEQSDQEAAAVATAPRVTLANIHANIGAQYIFTAKNAVEALNMPPVPELSILTICIVVMTNGFVVIGKSAPASPENFNADLGAKLAKEDCIRQIWPLMGFELRCQLHRQTHPV